MTRPRAVIPIHPAVPAAANTAPGSRYHLMPALASWQYAGRFKGAVFVLVISGAVLLGLAVPPWIAGLVAGASLLVALAVAEVVLRRRSGHRIPVVRDQPVARMTWAVLASVMVFGAAFAVGMGLEGRWLAAIVGGVLLPAGALVDWLFLRRASPEAARVADYGLTYLMLGLLMLGWLTGAWERLP